MQDAPSADSVPHRPLLARKSRAGFSSTCTRIAGILVLLSLVACSTRPAQPPVHPAPAPPAPADTTAFLVVAPDRGFQGNEEIRDALASLGEGRAELVFVTDERTAASLQRALAALARRSPREIVVLPLYLSAADPDLERVRTLLVRLTATQTGAARPRLRMSAPFGASYLAVELLADRLRDVQAPGGKRLIVIGHGAEDDASRRKMQAEWQELAERAAAGFGFEAVRAVVWDEALEAEARSDFEQARKDASAVVVVPFHMGMKYDSMMSFSGFLAARLPKDVEAVATDVTPHPVVGTWLLREVNRYLPQTPDDVGVVLLAHGADHHWNETMRSAAASLAERYKTEFAFCMADAPLVERAIRKLERRGARTIVVVRVFGLGSSFRTDVERMLGLDVELGRPASSSAGGHAHHGHRHGHGHGHGHGGHGHGGSAPRIRSTAVLTTAGGLDAHALFAQALFDRAREHSRDPARETVILVAHGAGEDQRNAEWLANLERLAAHMKTAGGSAFRAIRVATWREDWPAKREPWIATVRGMVEEARRDGGRAIVVPARTTEQGPEREFLAGLEFDLGKGFAPHPLFDRWLEEQVQLGLQAARAQSAPELPGPKSRTDADTKTHTAH